MQKKTLVIGASKETYRYSNRFMKLLKAKGIPVVGLGRYNADIEGGIIYSERKQFENIDTISIYLRKYLQEDLYNYIIALNPKRIIFNPGAENQELFNKATEKGIDCIYACSIVMLSTGQY